MDLRNYAMSLIMFAVLCYLYTSLYQHWRRRGSSALLITIAGACFFAAFYHQVGLYFSIVNTAPLCRTSSFVGRS